MDIVILFGPQAVGKMTVGEALQEKTGLKLFHNHMTIDLILQFFTWEEGIDLILDIREKIYQKMAKSDQRGMIITFVWAFNLQSDWDYVAHIVDIFKEHNLYYVELNADVETRLTRNVSENRLEKKWTKRNTEWSNNELVSSMDKHRMISHEGEVFYKPYVRIDNTFLSAEETAELIINKFQIKRA